MIVCFLVVCGVTFGVLFTIDKKNGGGVVGGDEVQGNEEQQQETTNPEEASTKVDASWNTDLCGSKTLLDVDITDKFESSTEPCENDENPFSILGYRDEAIFYSGDLFGKRPIYLDEIEQNEELKAKIFEFLTEATSQRGINTDTKYGLVNGWVDSTQVVNNCG